MFPLNDYCYYKDYELNRLPKVKEEAEKRRLLEEAGIIRRPWLSCQVCRSLWQLGHTMVKAGRRLERRYGPLIPSHARLT